MRESSYDEKENLKEPNPLLIQALSKNNISKRFKFIIKNTITGKIVLFMWAVFFIQYIAYPIFIGPIYYGPVSNGNITDLWAMIFTVKAGNEIYVWTYFTSIFSHGSIFHIIINSIVLLMFGILVEEDFSKRNYIGVFLFGGALASLIQILVVNMAYIEFFGMYLYSSYTDFLLLGSSGSIAMIIGLTTMKMPNIEAYFILIPFYKLKLVNLTYGFIIVSFIVIITFGVGAFQIAHTAHITGVIIGLIIGNYKYRYQPEAL